MIGESNRTKKSGVSEEKKDHGLLPILPVVTFRIEQEN